LHPSPIRAVKHRHPVDRSEVVLVSVLSREQTVNRQSDLVSCDCWGIYRTRGAWHRSVAPTRCPAGARAPDPMRQRSGRPLLAAVPEGDALEVLVAAVGSRRDPDDVDPIAATLDSRDELCPVPDSPDRLGRVRELHACAARCHVLSMKLATTLVRLISTSREDFDTLRCARAPARRYVERSALSRRHRYRLGA
jgi:hypothetical protein